MKIKEVLESQKDGKRFIFNMLRILVVLVSITTAFYSLISDSESKLSDLQIEINFNKTSLKELSEYAKMYPNEFGVQEELNELSERIEELLKIQNQ